MKRKSLKRRTLLHHAPYAGITQIRLVGYFSVCPAADTPGEAPILANVRQAARQHGASIEWLKWLITPQESDMQVTATEAKNRFGQICAQAKREPVFVEKGGRVDSVILSVEQFEALKASRPPKSMEQRRMEFNEQYKDWIAEQNRQFDAHGLWCDGVVAW